MTTEQTIMQLSKKLYEPDWLIEKRKKAFDTYNQLPTPVLTYGMGINIDSTTHTPPTLNPETGSGELIITGAEETEVLSLKKALNKYESFFKTYFTQTPTDKYAALHQALYNTVICIRIPKGITASTPLTLQLNLNDPTRIEYIFVFAEEHSTLTIIDNAHSTTPSFRSQVVHIIAQEGAHLTYISNQQLDNTTQFTRKTATAHKNAHITWLDSCLGSTYTKSSTTTILAEEGAESNHAGLYFGTQNQVFDIDANVIHEAPHTTSNIITKGALNNHAKTIYQGLIKIQPHAHGCKGYQHEDTLLLSEHAEADAVPNLEIHNDDVSCSHGTTISHIDAEKLFYLTSRGLTENEAQQNIIEGFFEPIIQQMNHSSADQLRKAIIERVTC